MARNHFALVSEVKDHSWADLLSVSAAVQKQLIDDVAPVWGIYGSIDAFPALDVVPPDYWPVIVSDEFDFPPLGFHHDLDGNPFALVKHTDSWSMSVSHEVIEALIDPDGDRWTTAPSVVPEQGTVEHLVEVCDPAEAAAYSYEIDGILVSDFYTPHYFDDEFRPGVRYSFRGNLTRPRQVLPDGYLTWRYPRDGMIWQDRRFGGTQGPQPIGPDDEGDESPRAWVDRVTPHRELERGLPEDHPKLIHAIERMHATRAAAQDRARRLRDRIAELEGERPPVAARDGG
jgi:hypothetical protein